MKCKNHNEIEANYYCSFCGQPLCLECSLDVNGRLYCKECLEKSVELSKINFTKDKKFKKSGFLTFILSVVPGAGHMYLGLINKGLSIMILFFGLIFLADTIDNLLFLQIFSDAAFMIALFVIFISYSIFDALAKVREINNGFIVNDSKALELSKFYEFLRVNILGRKNFIGYAFIVLGCLSIFSMLSRTVDHLIRNYLSINFPFTMTDVLISVILVGTGVFFIRKGTNFR